MNLNDPNLPMLESVVRALGPLRERFVFIGGCVAGLLHTDTAAAAVRATRDVDVVVEVTTLTAYHAVEHELRTMGFLPDRSQEAPICRWHIGPALLDIVPTDAGVLGFGNRWFEEVARTAQPVTLPGGLPIRLITAPLFLATKMTAFDDRGGGDFLASHDLEDIVALVDGRPELIDEVRASSEVLRLFVTAKLSRWLADPVFAQALPGHFPLEDVGQMRLPVVLDRLRQIAAV